MPGAPTLHGYWRSTASWRVRIALQLKGMAWRNRPHDLRRGEHRAESYRRLNPQAYVPALELEDGQVLTQSLAIIEWLEETRPEPPLLPAEPIARARVRAAALVIAADTHPIQNLNILKAVEALADGPAARRWAADVIGRGLDAFEALIAPHAGPWCFGASPGLADVVLIPQLGNAERFGVALDSWPAIARVAETARQSAAFEAARPEHQPDADPA